MSMETDNRNKITWGNAAVSYPTGTQSSGIVTGVYPSYIPPMLPPVTQSVPLSSYNAKPSSAYDEEKQRYTPAAPAAQKVGTAGLYAGIALLALIGIPTLGLSAYNTKVLRTLDGAASAPTTVQGDRTFMLSRRPPPGNNVCVGQKPNLPNKACVDSDIAEQSAADITKGFVGLKNTTADPITTSFWKAGLCPVNVHWHLGTEHRSAGQYDEQGKGPTQEWKGKLVKETGKPPRQGMQCRLYDPSDAKFTTEYNWQHCKHMQVGQTYEVHWPHSAAGACGTPNQYQTPFYDGVFCIDGVLTKPQAQIGVQAQVFTIVNDEQYYYPDLMRGMIVEGDKGADMAFYTGSTTSDKRDNTMCSQFGPISWQVDRKCHLVSASSFDKMCADMMSQRDDMSDDLYPAGSRELVNAKLQADNVVSGSVQP